MKAHIHSRPNTFDRVDRIKWALGHPVLKGDHKLWIIGGPLLYEVDSVHRAVPPGFTTDGASVPRIGQILTGWSRWDEPQRWAAIVHDALYAEHGVAKSYADLAFRALLDSEGASWWMRTVMYAAVRVGGGPAYRSGQRAGPAVYRRDIPPETEEP